MRGRGFALFFGLESMLPAIGGSFGLRAACCRFDEASLLAVGFWVRGFV
jgi:hypothetical protein